jgi:hypothetical protein
VANKLTDKPAPGALFTEEDAPVVKRARKPQSPEAKAKAAARRKTAANVKRQQITTPGFYHTTALAYHANPCPAPSASSGVIRDIARKSPAHARARNAALGGTAQATSDAMDIGSALHAMMWPEAMPPAYREEVEFIPVDSWRGDYATGRRNAARRANRIPVMLRHRDMLEGMVAIARPAILAVLGANSFSDLVAEMTMVWQSDKGFWRRGRPDIMSRMATLDYKSTTKGADPDSAKRLVFSEYYDLQQAHYDEGLDTLRPDSRGRREFFFFVQEQDPPHGFSIVQLDGHAQEAAGHEYRAALQRFDHGIATGEWPAYERQITRASRPGWRDVSMMDRMETGETYGE